MCGERVRWEIMKAKKATTRRTRATARVKEEAAVYHPAMKVAGSPAIDEIAD